MRLYSSSGGFTVYRGNYQYRVNIIIIIINYIFNNNVAIMTLQYSVGVHTEINKQTICALQHSHGVYTTYQLTIL